MNSRDLDESYGIDCEEDEEVEYGDQWVDVSEVLQVIELGPIYLMGVTEEDEVVEVIDSWEFQIMEFDETYDVSGHAAPANDHDKFEPSETASEETETEWDEDEMETAPGFQRRNHSETSETELVVDDSEDTEEEDTEPEWVESESEGRKTDSEDEKKASSERGKSLSDGEDTETEPECEYDDSVFENDDSETDGHTTGDQVDAEDEIIHQDLFPEPTYRHLITNESNLKPHVEKNVLGNIPGVNRLHDFHLNP